MSSDGKASLDQGYQLTKVEDTFNEFYQVWLKVRDLDKWVQADWTVKVDADAVFITQRLRSYLSTCLVYPPVYGFWRPPVV